MTRSLPGRARLARVAACSVLALVACGADRPAARAPETAAAPAPALIATARTDVPHVSVALLAVTRVGAATADVRFSLSNAPDAPGPSPIADLLASVPGDRGSVADVYLVEPAAAKKYFVVRGGDRTPVSSHDLEPLAPGESRVLWARLAAPPPGADTVGVKIPHTPLFADVPIGGDETARAGAGKEPSRQAGRM